MQSCDHRKVAHRLDRGFASLPFDRFAVSVLVLRFGYNYYINLLISRFNLVTYSVGTFLKNRPGYAYLAGLSVFLTSLKINP